MFHKQSQLAKDIVEFILLCEKKGFKPDNELIKDALTGQPINTDYIPKSPHGMTVYKNMDRRCVIQCLNDLVQEGILIYVDILVKDAKTGSWEYMTTYELSDSAANIVFNKMEKNICDIMEQDESITDDDAFMLHQAYYVNAIRGSYSKEEIAEKLSMAILSCPFYVRTMYDEFVGIMAHHNFDMPPVEYEYDKNIVEAISMMREKRRYQ